MNTPIQLPTDQNFGAFVACIFGLIAAYGFWTGRPFLGLSAVFLAALFIFLTIVAPHALRPLNKLWMRFGRLLGRLISPIILGAIFFLIFTPIGLIMRLVGRDELRLKRRATATHWQVITHSEQTETSFKNQF
jgi:hypothetical protein